MSALEPTFAQPRVYVYTVCSQCCWYFKITIIWKYNLLARINGLFSFYFFIFFFSSCFDPVGASGCVIRDVIRYFVSWLSCWGIFLLFSSVFFFLVTLTYFEWFRFFWENVEALNAWSLLLDKIAMFYKSASRSTLGEATRCITWYPVGDEIGYWSSNWKLHA